MELEQEIKTYLKKNIAFSIDSITLLVYSIECNQKNDLYLLAKALQEENSLNKIVEYFSGTTVKIPTKQEYTLYTQIAFYFYLTEIEGKKFSEITEMLNQSESKVNHIIIGKKLSEFKSKLNSELNKIIKELL